MSQAAGPAGGVSRFAFDAGVRFDGTLGTADVSGAWLATRLRRANQGPETPFEKLARAAARYLRTPHGPC